MLFGIKAHADCGDGDAGDEEGQRGDGGETHDPVAQAVAWTERQQRHGEQERGKPGVGIEQAEEGVGNAEIEDGERGER